jgi:hypothetical protein
MVAGSWHWHRPASHDVHHLPGVTAAGHCRLLCMCMCMCMCKNWHVHVGQLSHRASHASLSPVYTLPFPGDRLTLPGCSHAGHCIFGSLQSAATQHLHATISRLRRRTCEACADTDALASSSRACCHPAAGLVHPPFARSMKQLVSRASSGWGACGGF